MLRLLTLIATVLALSASPASARQVVTASDPQAISVTVYRDPGRNDRAMNLRWLNGFALINETRTVTLPPGETRIRFDGVAESMVAISAIVTGLPGGTIEKNRNADLLSPAALVDGTLGKRVTITRTNPATGAKSSESAIVRTRADGGLVLETSEGFEAVRCAGLPETLTFGSVPDGLSAQPVFTIDTRSETGGTYTVQLTYLASGFDWNAHYVATFEKAGQARERKLRLRAWLTLANANGQSFADAELLAVAGKLEVQSDYRGLSQPPRADGLRLTCYPLGSTATGMPIPRLPRPAPPPMVLADYAPAAIVVTAQRRSEAKADMAVSVTAIEEALGDLKLYRVPMPVTVAAKAQKQVAFLDLGNVEGKLIHRASCTPYDAMEDQLAEVVLRTRNLEKNGLGRALPAGGITVFEPSAYGPLLITEDTVRDFAVGQEVEIGVAPQSRVRVSCKRSDPDGAWISNGQWHELEAEITNDSNAAIEAELRIANPANWQVRKASTKPAMQNGMQVLRIRIPAGATRNLRWHVRYTDNAKAEAAT